MLQMFTTQSKVLFVTHYDIGVEFQSIKKLLMIKYFGSLYYYYYYHYYYIKYSLICFEFLHNVPTAEAPLSGTFDNY